MELPTGMTRFLVGGGAAETGPEGEMRLIIPPKSRGYADAQLDDHRHLPRRCFPWRPPVRFSLKARASHAAPLGTLGFGFWNDPVTMSLGQGGAARRLPALPRAIWFFYGSPPNHLSFKAGVPGHGWKAVSLTTPALPAPLLAPAAAGALALSHLPGLRRIVMKVALRSVTADEVVLDEPLDAWHTYRLEWQPCEASFEVDGKVVLVASSLPPGPLGFVAWIDNQYAVASPESGFRFGVVPTQTPQWLEIAEFNLHEL